jgi:hypothetical protein
MILRRDTGQCDGVRKPHFTGIALQQRYHVGRRAIILSVAGYAYDRNSGCSADMAPPSGFAAGVMRRF